MAKQASERGLVARLFEPIDIASLVYYRIAFASIALWETWRFASHGWIERYLMRPSYHFTFYGFDWVQPWPGEGMYWRLDTSKDRVVFDELRTTARLAAGQMLVLAATPDSDGSLGQHFHKVASPDGPQDKLILVRLAQIPADLDLIEDDPLDQSLLDELRN